MNKLQKQIGNDMKVKDDEEKENIDEENPDEIYKTMSSEI